jgi:hypothetical protein
MKLTPEMETKMFRKFWEDFAPEFETEANIGLIRGLLKAKSLPVDRQHVELAFNELASKGQLGRGDLTAIAAYKKQLEEDARPKPVPEKPVPEWGVLDLARIKAIPPDDFRRYMRNPQFKAELNALKLKR